MNPPRGMPGGFPLARSTARLALALLTAALTCPAEAAFKVEEGFSVIRAAGPPQIEFPMFGTSDEAGVLFVAESSGLDLYAELQKQTRRCRISRLEDRDGDGVFERATVFADRLVFPMGLAWREGALYVADPPDVIVLKDRDGDGRADERSVLLTGFGHKDNGSLHGLIFGPDGWLYMTMGQPDGYRIKRPDGTYLEGKSGALLRCRPDGSDVEVVARGFENLVEIEFLPGGEIVGTDNWFFLPRAGQRDALVHLLEGGVYPLNAHAKAERRHFDPGSLLPSITVYPAVALSGMVRYRGTQFPSRFRDCLFTAAFNARKITAHRLQRQGASFRVADTDFLTTDDPDFHPSDVLEARDGSLLVIDTGAWYVQHCPTGRIRPTQARGGVYRIGSRQRPVDPEPRPDFPADQEASTLTRTDNPQIIFEGLSSTNSDRVAQAARMLGRRGDKSAEAPLLGLLSRPELHVRLAAAEALAHCGSSNAIPGLTTALAANDDPFLSHALVFALHRLADGRTLSALLERPHPRLQQAALILLDQAPHRSLEAEAVLERVVAGDEGLRRTARTILQKHPEWAPRAAPLLRELIEKADDNAESTAWPEWIVAFQNDPSVQSLVARAITNTQLSAARRAALLASLTRTTISPLPDGWLSVLGPALHSSDGDVCFQAVRVIELRRLTNHDAGLAELIGRAGLSVETRLTALRAVLPRQPQLTRPAFQLLLQRISPGAEPAARLSAAGMFGRSRWPDPELDPETLLAAIRGDRLISTSTLLPLLLQSRGKGFEAAWKYLDESVEQGWRPTDKELQLIRNRLTPEADREFARLTERLAQRATSQREQIDRYADLLSGGDPVHGRRWFSEKAGCIACHRVGMAVRGGILGPDLARVGAIRSGRDLLESIVLPSATLAQGYESYGVVLRNGEEFTGLRVRQDDEDSFVLRDASGREVRLESGQVQSAQRLAISLMPEGLLEALGREEVRDLLAYLQSLK